MPDTTKFQIGGPEKLSVDLKMQLGGPEDDRNIMDLIRAMTGRAATSGLEKFSHNLQEGVTVKKAVKEIEDEWASRPPLPREYDEWEKLKKREAENTPEKLRQRYGDMMEQQIGVVDDIFRISIDQKKNAYPYDHRTAELTVRTVIETAQALQKEEWAQDPEAQVWLKRMEKDASWMADLLQVTVAESAEAPFYFDVMLQIQTLKDHYRAAVTSENLQGLNATNLPGFEFSATETTLIKGKGIGLAIPDKYKKPEIDLTKGETLGLRELGIKMRDESFSIRMKMAAVSQADLIAANPEKTTFMGNNLRREELDFYKELLWFHEKGKGFIRAPHMISKDDEKKEMAAKLEAMLVTNANERLKDIMAGNLGASPDKASAISELVKSVKAEAVARLSNWRTRGKDIVSSLAVLTTRQGLYEDFALLHVYRYCWQFIWNTDQWGKVLSKSGVDTSGIYSYSGDAYSLHYMKRAVQYDRLGNSRTQFLLPTSRGGRAEVDLLRYDQMPHFNPNEVCLDGNNVPNNVDRFLQEQWNLLFDTDPASKAARKALGYEDIQEDVAKKLMEWATKWRVPFSSKYVEEGTDYELVVPHFMPPGLDVANFLEAITTGDVKLNKGGKTVWQELVEGTKLSGINWQKLENLPLDRWYVDLDMSSRYMKILIEVFEKEKDPFYSLVAGEPSTLGPKELAKRLRLTFRDSGQGGPEEYEIAFIPFFVTMACAAKYGLDSAEAWNVPADARANTTAVENFLLEMSVWQRAFKWLPSDRPKDAGLTSYNPKRSDSGGKELEWNYGNTMALMAEFYVSVLLRVKKSSAEESRLMTVANYEKTAKRLNKMPFIGTGSLKKKVDENIIPPM